jgi:TatD DNase family protein
MAMCDAFPGICYPMIGLHPTELGDDYNSVLDRLYNLLKSDDRFVAIGEVGLDFYWDDTKKREQEEVFRRQIEWALETGLPLAIHSRSAFDELYAVMDDYRGRGLTGVFHCFSGSEDEALKLLSFDGFYLGIGGVVTYKKSTLPSVLRSVPLERVVLETDSPYLAPVPKRGKRNESAYVPHVADLLAAVYDCSVEQVAAVTTANASTLFPKIAKL